MCLPLPLGLAAVVLVHQPAQASEFRFQVGRPRLRRPRLCVGGLRLRIGHTCLRFGCAGLRFRHTRLVLRRPHLRLGLFRQ